MKPIEREVLNLCVTSSKRLEDLKLDHNKRLCNYIFSSWSRWDVALLILEGGEKGISANKIAKGAQLSQRGCNHILDVMVAEGWAVHTRCPEQPCRSKYQNLAASPELKKFWSGYTDYLVKRMKACFVLKAHI